MRQPKSQLKPFPSAQIRGSWVALLTKTLLVSIALFCGTAALASPVSSGWIVVLGAAQYNGQPSVILRNRLEAALKLYRSGLAPRIAVTGGRGPGDRYSEGEVGCGYLRKRGVPPRNLLCETKSTSTWENLSNIRPTVGTTPIIIVTDEPHLPRALILAEQLGFRATGHAVKGHFKESYWQRENWLTMLARLGIR